MKLHSNWKIQTSRLLAAVILLSACRSAQAVIRHRLPLAANTTTHYYYDHAGAGVRRDFKCSTETYDGHHGTDFSGGPRGKAIYATHQGSVVTRIDGYGDGYPGSPAGGGAGNYYKLYHGENIYTLYMHMTKGSLSSKGVGASIACSERLGGVGTSGSSSGLHLHLDTRTGSTREDPYAGCAGGPVSYWVSQAYNSETVSLNCQNGAPAAPSALTATAVSASQINLGWADNSSNESGFKIERGNGTTWTQIVAVGANVRTYANTGLASGTKYFYRVRSYNAAGHSGYSAAASATTKDVIPAAPTSLVATAASDVQINLTWAQAMANEDGFRIYRSTDNVTFTLVATVGINVVAYNNTGLVGNTLYYYKVAAYNTAGNSAFSNTASDTTAPKAPSALVVNAVAGTTNWNKLALGWTDNAGGVVGFKIERGTALAGPFTQISTNAAGVTTYTDSGLGATTTYFYRVRSYNGNGNSSYSAVASRATPNAPPVLAAIGDKTVAAGTALAFTATASDPNAPAPSTVMNFTWEGSADGDAEIVFRRPANSGSTTSFIDTVATNYTNVKTGAPAGVGGTKALKSGWTFKTGTANYWVRYTTASAPTIPNPTIALDQVVKLRLYSTKALKVGLGVRETGTTAAYGADGGLTGSLEWVAVTNVVSGSPIPNRAVTASNWTTLTFNIPFEPQASFTGDGKVDQSGAKGVLEHIVLSGNGGTGAYVTWLDDVQCIVQNNLTYSLDAGAPAGSTIGRRNGKFAWTPAAGISGVYPITVRVTDSLGGQDFETIQVTVTGTGNAAPVLAAIGNKTVNENSALNFTATATDANVGQTKTFTLDVGNPLGSSINSSSGVFTWTPTEAQGPGSYPITVRVTDNGSPVSNDFETITVTVNEANVAPALAAIANQTINEGSILNVTASATDSDVPANSVIYSLNNAPAGMTIDSGSGAIGWTPGETDGTDVHQVTVQATDNGNPSLSSTRTFNVTVNEVNSAPTLNVGTTVTQADIFADFENFEDTGSGTVMFRQPYFSSTTTNFVESTANFSTVVAAFPEGNLSTKVLHSSWSFKTGTTNPWMRLTTFNSATATYYIPNPTIDITKRMRFDVWTDKSIKLAPGIRETGTTAPIGLNGGFSGPLEWVGATAIGSSPNPSRVINSSNWTTVEFNFPSETITAFPGSGDGVLSSPTGKAVFEHLCVVPNGGMGLYNIYLDNFEVVSVSSNLTINTGDTLTLTNSATDSDFDAATGSQNSLIFSLDAGAPTNATIDPDSGELSWTPTPEQSPSTNVVTIRVTDDGVPALSDAKNITIIVNKVNTAPMLAATSDVEFVPAGELVEYQASAIDNDIPADTLTFSLVGTVPPGATINSSSGYLTWTAPSGSSTNIITIRVTDSGTPPLYDEMDLSVVVGPTNTAPVISLGAARITEKVVAYETFTNATPNEQVMFKKPANSATTSAFVDTVVTNYTTVTTSFPAGNANAGAKTMKVVWTFKTGLANQWVRLNTLNTTFLPNPAINASARLKVDVHCDKQIKVALGIRETGTAAVNGGNGGTTGSIEYVGASSVVGGAPQPTRTITANTWTTLEFDLPNEPKVGFTGDGILTGGQQALEHIALVGTTTGAHTLYLDNFEVVTTSVLPTNLIMKASSVLTLTAASTDVENNARYYSIEENLPVAATINTNTGAFSWTPGTGDVGTTNDITIVVRDVPSNGAPAKQDSSTFTVSVIADSLAPQSVDGTFVTGGDSVTLTWESVAGASYQVQSREQDEWIAGETMVATASVSSLQINNGGTDKHYRIVEISGSSTE